ncbi:photosynthetic NDH subunit of lumenal location 3, chloroplastic-like isoform X1 [Dioscorea cayenensis subsp. rotundata]|uniref:Photosynthetic NDH subunit of lumenal location 3, chloroplastic-like isoform X1 n=2 Tax=Dioscorea cayennensis subsp. rotundata TaxID=55577 RepID=A0AB40CGS4_DIOCR|nr:photosynthetic NDH subunit of lumenal location 3, chloroplastic-like isoform X1 [Dioscorea cayenensis subsp. rotundata]
MDSMKSKGSLCRIRKCVFDLLSMEEELVDENDDNFEFIRKDLRLKSTFLYFDLSQIISIAGDEHKKASLTHLANTLFSCIEKLGNALKSRRVSLIQIHYHDAALALQEVMTALQLLHGRNERK